MENASSATPVDCIVMRSGWLRAIGKAASALRFSADHWEWNTEAAKAELRAVAETLCEIESSAIGSQARVEDCGSDHVLVSILVHRNELSA